MSGVYYNDIDPFAAAWLRELINAGQLPEGEVDERSILDIELSDVRPFRQCHFFAGIGGWPYALTLARWPEDREVWTASLPCQPLSVAGKRHGALDGRHLWPAFCRLLSVCRPAIVVGEQVASIDGREWLAGVRLDMEAAGYACGAANLPACGVGAPHRRERLFWGAVAKSALHHDDCSPRATSGQDDGAVADADGSERRTNTEGRRDVGDGSDAGRAEAHRRCSVDSQIDDGRRRQRPSADSGAGFWSDAEWLVGADGKARRVKPGVRLLAHGLPNRVGALRGFGNAIIPQVAAEFIRAIADGAALAGMV